MIAKFEKANGDVIELPAIWDVSENGGTKQLRVYCDVPIEYWPWFAPQPDDYIIVTMADGRKARMFVSQLKTGSHMKTAPAVLENNKILQSDPNSK